MLALSGRFARACLLGATLLSACGAGEEAADAAPDVPPPQDDALVVLQYHFVSADRPRSTSLTPEEFEGHLEMLDAAGATVLDLPDALERLAAGEALPPRAVAITFDDGYLSVYTEAAPRLAARRWPYTVFVNPGAIDDGSGLHADWRELAEMQAQGATIANHGVTHAFLARRDPRLPPETDAAFEARMSAEIAAAEDRIAAELGVRHGLFAYPYGEYDDRVRAWLAANGYVGFGQHSGVVWSGADRLALPRFPVSGSYADADGFAEKIRMGPLPVLDPGTLPEPGTATAQPRPVLVLQVASEGLRTGTLACYASGQGRIDAAVSPAGPARVRVEVRAASELALGRSRYNCTAQDTTGRWLWFSQPWLRLGPDGVAPP